LSACAVVSHCTPYDRNVAFFAGSRLVLLNNCGHWPPFEKPAQWTAQVLAFPQGLVRGDEY